MPFNDFACGNESTVSAFGQSLRNQVTRYPFGYRQIDDSPEGARHTEPLPLLHILAIKGSVMKHQYRVHLGAAAKRGGEPSCVVWRD